MDGDVASIGPVGPDDSPSPSPEGGPGAKGTPERSDDRTYWTTASLRNMDESLSGSINTEEALTVDYMDSQESYDNDDEEPHFPPTNCELFARWMAMLLLFVGGLVCLVFSKLSIVALGTALYSSKTNNVTTSKSVNKVAAYEASASVFLMLLITLLIPYGLTLIKSIWTGGFTNERLWPSLKAFLLGLLSSILECFGICLFALEVLSKAPGYLNIWIMDGVFLVPILSHLIRGIVNRTMTKKWMLIAMVVALVLEVAGIILTCLFEFTNWGLHKRIRDVWPLPISLLCVSLAWMPYFQQRQTIPSKKALADLIRRKPVLKRQDPSNGLHSRSIRRMQDLQDIVSGSVNPQDGNINLDELSDDDAVWLVMTYPQFSARWKNAILQNFFKILFTIGISLLLGHLRHTVDIKHLQAGLYGIDTSHQDFSAFMCNIFCNFGAYLFGWIACTICMQKQCFALPLVLASPICLLVTILNNKYCLLPSWVKDECGQITLHHLKLIIPAATCLFLAQMLSTGLFIFQTQTIVMQLESHLFWQPGYNSLFLEQWLLLNRKTVQAIQHLEVQRQETLRSRVFICTTMYRESVIEMCQLLHSLKRVNSARLMSSRQYEAHIFFDNGVRDSRLTKFALQLVHCVKNSLDVGIENVAKVMTPYGMKLTWELARIDPEQQGMVFSIHFKDNKKVKSKKRWSQVMYMSYVLDFFIKEDPTAANCDDNNYILTTDADVKFEPESVEALLDLLARDQHVGAVCSRTYPLGSGPIYWFQIFDYAIGHWFQKAANHVLGSVLCCPGCFSAYRVTALRGVLPMYATKVDKASEFLTKDMGEDRWLCSLLVHKGWRLEYCAAASNSTFCPEDFDEFYKQRRRWTPSTLANQVLLLQQWRSIMRHNKGISMFFILYQGILLLSSLINPSVCILIISGGLFYAWEVPQALSTSLLIIVFVVYTVICLRCTQNTQLMIAKILTMLFAMLMAAVTIGTIVGIVEEIGNFPEPKNATHTPTNRSVLVAPLREMNHQVNSTIKMAQTMSLDVLATPSPSSLSIRLPISVTTLYLTGLIGTFVVTALMHTSEAYCLFHGIWYLICLPSVSLILLIYSLCNMTDRSWGTREEKKSTTRINSGSWKKNLIDFLKIICFCCKEKFPNDEDAIPSGICEDEPESLADIKTPSVQPDVSTNATLGRSTLKPKSKTPERTPSMNSTTSTTFQYVDPAELSVPVSRWLPRGLRNQYADLFVEHGYDDTSFIAGMNDSDLKEIGVLSTPIRQKLLVEITELPEFEVASTVPDDVREWLQCLDLAKYGKNFRSSQIINTRDLETLKGMTLSDIKTYIGITKPGENDIEQVKYEVEAVQTHYLASISPRENDFWIKLRSSCLLPDSAAFAHDHDLKEKLTELRNSTLMSFYIVNAIWIILITTLLNKSELNVINTNPLGLSFLVIFGFVLIVQFGSMIVHRCSTLLHVIARTPFTRSFPGRSDDHDPPEYDREAHQIRQRYNQVARRRYQQQVNGRRSRSSDGYRSETERTPLITHSQASINTE